MTDDTPPRPVSGLSRHRFAPPLEAVPQADASRIAELFIAATRWGGRGLLAEHGRTEEAARYWNDNQTP